MAFVFEISRFVAQLKLNSMKNLYFILTTLILSFVSNSQTILWQDDFDDPNIWTADGPINVQGFWDMGVNTDVPEAVNYMGAMESTTNSNGFAFFDAIQYFVSNNVTYQEGWIEMSNSINLSAHQNVIIQFEQRYQAYIADETFVEVSTDGGTTWSNSIDVNEDVLATGTAIQNTRFIKFAVNNSSTVKFRFRWESQYDGGYGWMVDDFYILSVPANDIATSNLLIESDELMYYQIPETQISPINFSILAKNMGSNIQNNVQFIAEESSSGYLESSSQTNILVDQTDSLYVNNPFTPPGLGSYSVQFQTESQFTDELPQNNQIETYNFEVTNHIYARDNNVVSSALFSPYNTEFEGGNTFTIYEDQFLTAIDGYFHSDMYASSGIDVYSKVYLVEQNGEFTQIGESVPYTAQPADVGAFNTFTLQSPVLLEAGNSYVVTVGSANPALRLAYSTKSAPLGTALLYGDFGANVDWYASGNTVMVRMNFDPCLATFNNLDLTTTDVFCAGACDGSALDNESSPLLYEYNWYDGSNNLIFTGTEITNLCAGNYSVTKEDQCGNFDQVNFTIEENVVNGGVGFDNLYALTCSSADGSIVFSWDVPLSYLGTSITIECSGPSNETITTNASSIHTIPNLMAGTYTVTITDNENGCEPWVYTTEVPYLPIEQSLCVVTVDSLNTDQNIIVWEKPADLSQIDSFFVYREITANNYEFIGGVHVDSLSQLIDTSANPNTTAYRYKISALNICGSEMTLSPYHNTIHLQFQGNGNFNWNHYQIENETGVVDSYNFYRDNNSDGNWQLIQVISGNQNTYTDQDFDNFPNASYFVDVNWSDANLTCQATKAQDYNSSRSNKYSTEANTGGLNSDIINDIQLYPNPTGDALFIKINATAQDIEIISTLGQSVYQSNSLNNDKIDVSNLQPGVYVLKIKTSTGLYQSRFVKK